VPVLLRSGDRLARYIVRRPLGHGGSSDVYLVEDAESGEPLALKVLHAVEGDAVAGRARFRDEFEIAGKLDHPNIARVSAHGECGDVLWLIEEYFDGGSAVAFVPGRRATPDLSVVLPVLTQIAGGLDYAHARDVVHLDVKPSNMLVRTGDPMTVALADFGAAHRLGEPRSPGAVVVGSIPYVAPEELRGEQIYAATDQYSLACSVVELLTGHPPFRRRSQFAVAEAHLVAGPPPISPHHRWIPHAVDSILAKMLAKDPRERYNSCAEPIELIAHALRDIDPDE
jgi:serine/threonine-protein kinase